MLFAPVLLLDVLRGMGGMIEGDVAARTTADALALVGASLSFDDAALSSLAS